MGFRKTMKVISFTVLAKENPFDQPVVSRLRRLGVDFQIGKRRPVFSLLRAVREFGRPKVIHLHWLSMFWFSPVFIKSLAKTVLFIFDLAVVKLLGIKIVWTIHNKHQHERKYFLLDRLTGMVAARLSDRLLVFCPTARREISHFYHLGKTKKILVIPHPHYFDSYPNVVSRGQSRKRLKLRPNDFVFLFFGVIRPYKGILELLSAFRQLGEPKAKLMIAGLPLGEKFKKKLKLSLKKTPGAITDLRFIPAEEVQFYFQAADVVVLPYREILNSGSLFLAFSFAKPVIAPRLGCLQDNLNSQGGFLYDPQKPGALLKAMKKSLKADLLKMGEYNFYQVKAFGPAVVAQRLKKIYEDL